MMKKRLKKKKPTTYSLQIGIYDLKLRGYQKVKTIEKTTNKHPQKVIAGLRKAQIGWDYKILSAKQLS